MNNTKKLSLIVVFVLAALMSVAAMPVLADNAKTEAINEAKASFSDLYEAINPSVVYIYVAKAGNNTTTYYDMDEYDFDFGDIFGPQFREFFRQFEEEEENGERDQRHPEQEQQLTYEHAQ